MGASIVRSTLIQVDLAADTNHIATTLTIQTGM